MCTLHTVSITFQIDLPFPRKGQLVLKWALESAVLPSQSQCNSGSNLKCETRCKHLLLLGIISPLDPVL